MGFPIIGRTITSSTSRRIRTGTAGSGAAEFRSNSRSYKWGRRYSRHFAEDSRAEPESYRLATAEVHVFLRENAS